MSLKGVILDWNLINLLKKGLVDLEIAKIQDYSGANLKVYANKILLQSIKFCNIFGQQSLAASIFTFN